jgi:hypothetical protein
MTTADQDIQRAIDLITKTLILAGKSKTEARILARLVVLKD